MHNDHKQIAQNKQACFHIFDQISQGIRSARKRRADQNGCKQFVHDHGPELSTLPIE